MLLARDNKVAPWSLITKTELDNFVMVLNHDYTT